METMRVAIVLFVKLKVHKLHSLSFVLQPNSVAPWGRTPTYTHKHAVVTRRPTQTTPGESSTLFCLTQEYSSVSELDRRAVWAQPRGCCSVLFTPVHKEGRVYTVCQVRLCTFTTRLHEQTEVHCLRFVHYVRCSKKLRSHPCRRVEKTSSPLTDKKSEAIRFDEVGERVRGKNGKSGEISS